MKIHGSNGSQKREGDEGGKNGIVHGLKTRQSMKTLKSKISSVFR
jgi:hypothetical protein